eukprot:Pgem_evm1s5910
MTIGIQKSVPSLAKKEQILPIQQHRRLCFNYLQPWLKNLEYFNRFSVDLDVVEKEKPEKIISDLIALTARFADDPLLGTAIQTHVWKTIGTFDDMLDDVLDKLLKKAVVY